MTEKRPMRRKDRLVTAERTGEIIEKAEYGIFITADRKGIPYGVAVSPVLEGENIYFHCALEGRKLDNLKENPYVCMNFVASAEVDQEAYTTRYESAVVEGQAVMVEDREEKLHALRLICAKYAPHSFKDTDEYILPKLDKTGVCRIAIESLSGKVNEKR